MRSEIIAAAAGRRPSRRRAQSAGRSGTRRLPSRVDALAFLTCVLLLPACSGVGSSKDLAGPGETRGDGVDSPLAPPANDKPYSPNEVLVRVTPGTAIDELNHYYGTWTAGSLDSERVYLLGCPTGKTADELLPLMAVNPQVEVAEPNYWQETPEAAARTTSSMTFADSRQGEAAFADQDALRRIRAFEAQAFASGVGVIVAVLDTGVDARHPLLAGHLAPGGADLVDGDGDPSDLPDGRDSDGDGLTDEAVGHGTAVAGLVLSVAPRATILPIRILDSDGVGTAFGVVLGIELALRRGADVVNMSFGMSSVSRIVRDQLEEAHDHGGLLVASAGNRNLEDPPQYPAGVPVVLGVASTDSLDRKADFSNFGPWISVSAPGVGLVTPAPDGTFAVWSGTSFSAALVSGEAALLLSASSSGEGRQLPLTIREGVVPLDRADPTFGRALGSGRIDILAAILQQIGRSTHPGPARPRGWE